MVSRPFMARRFLRLRMLLVSVTIEVIGMCGRVLANELVRRLRWVVALTWLVRSPSSLVIRRRLLPRCLVLVWVADVANLGSCILRI